MDTISLQTVDNTNRYFKGQLKSEEIICFFRRHWIVLIKEIIGFLILNLILVSLSSYSFSSSLTLAAAEYKLLFLISLGFLGYLCHRFFYELLNYFLTMVIITNYRIIYLQKSILIHDDKDVIDLHEIQDIQKIQDGVMANILNFGQIKISLSGISDIRVLQCVPHPDRYFRIINQGKREYILKRRQEKRTLDEKEFSEAKESLKKT